MKRLIILLAAAIGLSAGAQSMTGTWEIFPNYTTPKRLVETPEFVYVLAGTGLCGYDKTTGEVTAYNVGNRLNGNQVENIWYDRDQKCLFVAYTDFNIDLMFDDGRTINVPDLRDAAMASDKTIRSAAFNNGKAYVGFSAGMLVIDMAHGAVIESCIWNKNITRIMATENKILLTVGYDNPNPLYVADQAGSHHDFNAAFTASTDIEFPVIGWARAGANTIVSQHGKNANSRLYLIKVNPAETNNAAAITYAKEIPNTSGIEYFVSTETDNIQPTKNGVLAAGRGKLFYINAAGEVTTKTVAASASNRVADWNGTADNLWLANAEGYGQYSTSTNAFTIPRTKPRSTSGNNVGNILPLPDGRLLIATTGVTHNSTIVNLAFGKPTYVDIMDSKGDLTAVPANIIRSSLFAITTNPKNSNEFITANASTALKTNFSNKTTLSYNTTNSSLSADWTYDVDTDNSGNLWLVQPGLTVHKALSGSWEGTSSDINGWSSLTIPDFNNTHSTSFVIDNLNKTMVITGKNMLAIVKMPESNQKLTTSTEYAIVPLSTDADGMALSGWHYPAITIDKNNWIWVGSDGGVFVIKNSLEMFNHGFAPMRPKVPRNDGTNLADFLLDNVEVSCIFVDGSNQKWIGTMGSGLYRVSADGTAILDHFTTDTSEIPSDNIFGVYADDKSNKVYVGTDQGLSIYHAKSSPAAPDYDDVYAYPNPVTPDYTGWITISGLMDNSLVKIADASGRVFFEGKSDGGLLVWDGCDASGNRVKSGVYFVFASQHTDGSSAAAVTKIVVIN